MAAYRGLKQALAHYAKCRHPGHIPAGNPVRVQTSRNDPKDWVDVGALLRGAGIAVGSGDEDALIAWALGLGDCPTAAYKRVSRALNRARDAGRDDLVEMRRRLPETITTMLPGGPGLRELPLDPRSPLHPVHSDYDTPPIGTELDEEISGNGEPGPETV